MVEPSKEARKLPVRLTRDEYDAKAAELAAKLMSVEEMEESLKSVQKTMKEQIEGVKKEIKVLTKIVRTSIEDRDIECVEIRDEERMVMNVIRTDTHETVETRPMTATERQLIMFPISRLRVVDGPNVEEVKEPEIDQPEKNAQSDSVPGTAGDTAEAPPEEPKGE